MTAVTETVFVARQPVLDRVRRVHGYELLHRTGQENRDQGADAVRDAMRIIADVLNSIAFRALVGNRRAFIPMTYGTLVHEYYRALPIENTVLELLETVDPSDDVVAACRSLKRAGYQLALDDFNYHEGYEPLLEIADVVKVDFLATEYWERKSLADLLSKRNVRLLAEKVETHQQFREAVELGYSYFQGFFFCQPQIVRGREISSYKRNYVMLLQQVNEPRLDFKDLADVIRRDVALSCKLLKYLNSVPFAFRHKITSVKQALVMLGENAIRRWVGLTALSFLCEDKPSELVLLSMVRAYLCEELAADAGLDGRELDLFMMGLASALDAMVDMPRDELLIQLPLARDAKIALRGGRNRPGQVLALALALEAGRWGEVDDLIGQLHLTRQQVSASLEKANAWAGAICGA